jgi:hypothetical protein
LNEFHNDFIALDLLACALQIIARVAVSRGRRGRQPSKGAVLGALFEISLDASPKL